MGGFNSRRFSVRVKTLGVCLFAAWCLAGCATTPPASNFMPSAGLALPPLGLLDLCRRQPDFCEGGVDDAIILADVRTSSFADLAPLVATASTASVSSTEGASDTASGLQAVGALATIGASHGVSATDGTDRVAASQASDLALSVASVAVQASAALFSGLREVNTLINDSITPLADNVHHGSMDHWALPLADGVGFGDCEDYALEKRRALIASGLPESALFMATAIVPDYGPHAVLVVRTSVGDYVLDNLTYHILPWDQTGYVWVSHQEPGRMESWRRVANPQSPAS